MTDALLNPRSIAIVGASDDPTRIGGRPLRYLLRYGYRGAIYPVNPRRDRVQGLSAYPSLTDVADDIDFVMIAVPAAQVAGVVADAVAKRVPVAMVVSSGFAETGADGAALQRDIARAAAAAGMRLLGPNCLGLFNSAIHFYPTFTTTLDRTVPQPGDVAVVSQSGAYGSHIYYVARERGIDIRYWVTTGNEADISVAEMIRRYVADDAVQTVMAYIESVAPRHGGLLLDALDAARAARKAVVVMKTGRSPAGAAAAASHTAALAGEDRVYDAVLRQYGAYRARSTEEMLDVAYACRPRLFPSGPRLGVVTISGGAGVLIADDAVDSGLDVAPMPDDAQDALRELVPFAAPRNPVDVTAQFMNDLSLIPRFTEVMLERGGYDSLLGFWTSIPGSPTIAEPLLAALRRAAAVAGERPFVQCAVIPEPLRRRYLDAGLPCFDDPTRAVTALAALTAFGRAFAAEPAQTDGGRAGALPAPATLPDRPLDEYDALRLLGDAGLPAVDACKVSSAAQAARAVAALGGPAVLKVLSADIAHKTDVGGVRLNVTAADAADVYDALLAGVAAAAPHARLDGALVMPQIDGAIECLLGATVDPVFGPVVLFGLGGIFAEALDDVACRRAPFDAATARAMIDELAGAKILRGARGRPGAGLDALADAIAALSRFVAANAAALASVEVNPLLALPERCVAVDALVVARRHTPDRDGDGATP